MMASRTRSILFNADEVRVTLDTIPQNGGVFELRALEATASGSRYEETYSGYFDNAHDAIVAIGTLTSFKSLYIVMNPMPRAMLARAINRMRPAKKNPLTSDSNITRRLWMLIDADAAPVAGVSTTDAEREKSKDLTFRICEALRAAGWPEPVLADSGNGYHLLFRIDLPADDDGLVKRVREALARTFDDEVKADENGEPLPAARVDTSVYNPARITKLYGSNTGKGDDMAGERPHRMSSLILVPDAIGVVTAEQLEAVAKWGGDKVSAAKPAATDGNLNGIHKAGTNGATFDFTTWMTTHGSSLNADGPFDWHPKGGGTATLYKIPVCPLNSEHTGSTAWAALMPSGRPAAGCRHQSCTWGWTDLRAKFDPEYRAAKNGTFGSAFQHTNGSATAEEIPPAPTDEELSRSSPNGGTGGQGTAGAPPKARLFNGPPIPLEVPPPPMLPAGLLAGVPGAFAEAVAVETETPLGLAVCNVLAVLAVLCQKRFSVRPEPGYFEPLSIWVAPAMEPGNRKTAVHLRATGPLYLWEQERATAAEETIAKAESEFKTAKARIEQLRQKAAKAEPAAYAALKDEIDDLEVNLPTVPTPPRLTAEDITVEHVATLMSQNGERIGILSDEGGVFDIIMGRYSNGAANVDVFNKAYSGSHVRVDRGSRPCVFLAHPALTFGVTPQPVIFEAIAKNERLRRSGFVDRFLYLLPTSRLGYRKLEQHPIDAGLLADWRRTVYDLAGVEPATDDKGEPVPHTLTFSGTAYRIWKDWQREVEGMLREGGQLEHLRGWGGKLAGNTVRLAGLMHCGELTFRAVAQREIQADTVQRAVELARVFLGHAMNVFDMMGSDPATGAANALWKVIAGRREEEFSARDAWNPLRGKFKRVGDVEGGFQKLIDHNLIAELGTPDIGKPGRPSRRFRVHPDLAEEWT
jgi:hypothetical protein